MQPEELERRIAAPDPPTVVDVRSRREYHAGHVPGAVHLPLWQAIVRPDVLGSRTSPVVVYCEHGPRAWLAILALRSAGTGRVELLRGHMRRWRSRGFPTATQGEP